MSEDKYQPGSESEGSETEAEESSERASTTQEGEESTDLNANAIKQIAKYQAQLDAGEITIDQIPEKQAWVKKNLVVKKDESDIESIIDAKVNEKLRSKEQELEVKTLKKELEALELDEDEQAEFDAEREELISGGLSEAKALSTLITYRKRLAEIEARKQKRAAMGLPKISSYNDGSQNVSLENWDKLSDDQIVEAWNKARPFGSR